MTEILKCPYCNEDLKEWDGRFYCANAMCPAKQEYLPKFIWRDLINGNKTQTAWDVAVYALKEYEDRDSYDCDGNWCGCEHSTAHKALTKITALEQKEQQ